MKYFLMLVTLMFLFGNLFSQQTYSISKEDYQLFIEDMDIIKSQITIASDVVVTDSIVWRSTDTLNVGDENCNHEWVFSDEERAGGSNFCLVNHNGWHCSYDDKVRYGICKKCLRKERFREQWYQSIFVPPKTEYEVLDSLLNKKLKELEK